MMGATEGSDLAGIVAMAAVAAMDGCPWVEKGHLWELSSAITEIVVSRVSEVDSFHLPDGDRWNRQSDYCPCVDEGCADCWKLVDEKQELRGKLADYRAVLHQHVGAVRQAYRQIQKFLDGGDRNCLIVAQAILDPVGSLDEYRGQ